MANESSQQNHRDFARLADASASASIATIGVFGVLALPLRLMQLADEAPTSQLWGVGILGEIILIGVVAAMVCNTYDRTRQ